MKAKQSGITLIGFLVVLIVVGFYGFMAMKLVPSYIEFLGVKKAMTQVSTEASSGRSMEDIRRSVMVKLNFQYVDDNVVSPKDITITRQNGASTLHVDYDKQIPFIANIDFLLHFSSSVPLQGSVGE